MNERDLNAGLRAIQLERTNYPDVADVHVQVLAIPARTLLWVLLVPMETSVTATRPATVRVFAIPVRR